MNENEVPKIFATTYKSLRNIGSISRGLPLLLIMLDSDEHLGPVQMRRLAPTTCQAYLDSRKKKDGGDEKVWADRLRVIFHNTLKLAELADVVTYEGKGAPGNPFRFKLTDKFKGYLRDKIN